MARKQKGYSKERFDSLSSPKRKSIKPSDSGIKGSTGLKKYWNRIKNSKASKNKYLILIAILIIPHVVLSVGMNTLVTSVGVTFAFYLLFWRLGLSIINKYSNPENEIRRNLSLLITTSFLFLFIGEIVLRASKKYESGSEKNGSIFYATHNKLHNWWGNEFKIQHEPNSVRKNTSGEFNFEHHYNNWGVRGPDITNKRVGELRIMVLGDSFSEGVGAPDSCTFPYLLQGNLRKAHGDSLITVLNFGRADCDPL